MKVTATLEGDQIFNLDVSVDLELENLKALLEFEIGLSSSQIVIYHNGRALVEEKKTLNAYGIREGDVLLIKRVVQSAQPSAQSRGAAPGGRVNWGSVQVPNSSQSAGGYQSAPRQPAQPSMNTRSAPAGGIDWGSIQIPNSSSHPQSAHNQATSGPPQQPRVDTDSPEYIRDMFLADPHQLSLLKERNPELADALLSGNLQAFAAVLQRQRQERADKDMQRIRTMNADPFDIDAQKRIAEEIRMSNVNQNMEIAMEYSPESFGKVVMLYINCKLDGHPVKAFVDSGAQMTFMSSACAERCNIMRLLDHRWAGIAKGVGTQKIVGRVHVAQIQIGNDFLPSSFSVMEDQPMDLVLGLDMLKRHQCSIDLKNNVLRIGTTGTETPFLAESELPLTDRLAFSDEGEQRRNAEDKQLVEIEDKELAEAMEQSAKEAAQGNSSKS